MTWPEIISIVPQFGLVVLFMFYQERSDKRAAEAREKQHIEWRNFMAEEAEKTRKEDEKNREAIVNLANMVATMNSSLIAHDAKVSPLVTDIERIRDRLAQAGIGKVEDSPIPRGKA